MDDCLSCPICFEPYSSNANIPLILICGHTLCSKCAETIYRTTQLICPQDRVYDYHSPDQLPRNITLLQILDHKPIKRINNPCQLHQTKKVKFYCISPCNIGFCSGCVITHQHHTWIDIFSAEANASFQRHIEDLFIKYREKADYAKYVKNNYENQLNIALADREYCENSIRRDFEIIRSVLQDKEKELINEVKSSAFNAEMSIEGKIIEFDEVCKEKDRKLRIIENVFRELNQYSEVEKMQKLTEIQLLLANEMSIEIPEYVEIANFSNIKANVIKNSKEIEKISLSIKASQKKSCFENGDDKQSFNPSNENLSLPQKRVKSEVYELT
ncbi:unnamed protein product [Blepharisma stoltei]|uniref:RING-type domain-containing protein n=1 Tax=Blepharisma stoltei TaxID=1481888 RepID=A0AAU9IKQ8_9CILI|nr:unnamed protein product [Blepharisma stoltei]